METVQPERVKLALRLGQSRALYEGFQVLLTACRTLTVLNVTEQYQAVCMRNPVQPAACRIAQPGCMQQPCRTRCGHVLRTRR